MKKVLRLLFTTLLLLSGFNLWLFTYGQQTLCEYLSDDEVRVGHISGFLPFFIVVEDVSYKDQVEIDQLSAWWMPTQLFWNEVRFTHVEVGRIEVRLPEEESGEVQMPAIDSRLTVNLRHITVDRLIVEKEEKRLDCRVAGKLSYTLRSGNLAGQLNLMGNDEEALSQLTFFLDQDGKTPVTHLTLHESERGPLSQMLDLPLHPAFTVSGDFLYDPLSEQTRADIEIATLSKEGFPFSEKLPFTLGSSLNGKATLLLEKHGAIHLHSVHLQTDNLDAEGELILTRAMKVESSRIAAKLHTSTGTLTAVGNLSGKLTEPEWDLEVASKAVTLFDRPLQDLKGSLRTMGDFTSGELDLSASLYGTAVNIKSGYILEPKESIHLTHMQARLPSGRMDGQLRIFFANKLAVGKVKGQFDDLSPLSGLLHRRVAGEGEVEITLSAKPIKRTPTPGQSMQLDAKGKGLVVDAFRADKGALTAHLDDLFGTPTGPLSFSFKDAEYDLWETDVLAGEITLTGGMSPFRVEAKGREKSGTALKAEGSWSEEELVLNTLYGKFSGRPVNLDRPLTYRHTADELSLSPIDFHVGEGGVAGSLFIAPNEVEIDLEMQSLPLTLVELLFPDLPLHGSATGSIHLTGNPHAPTGTLFLELIEAHFTESKPFTGDIALTLLDGRLELEAEGEESYLELDVGATLSLLDHSVTFDEEAKAHGRLRGKGKAASYLQLFVDDISRLDGELDIDLVLDGSVAKPKLYGTVAVHDGLYESLYTGAVFQKINGRLTADGNRLILTSFTARDGSKGSLTASGEFSLSLEEHLPYHMDLELSKVQLLNVDHARARASGKLTLAGNLDSGTIAGDMMINRADIEIPDTIPSTLYSLPVRYINSPPFEQPLSLKKNPDEAPYPISLNIHFNVPRTAYLKGRGLNTEWSGEVEVRGNTARPTLHGSLTVANGDFIFAGRQLTITSGSATVDGPPDETTLLDVASETTLDDTIVTVALHGKLDDLELDISSEPNLPLKEVLARLLFDKEFDEINKWQGLQLAQAIVHVTGGSFAPDIIGKLQRGFGLDRLEITGVDGDSNSLTDEELEDQHSEGQLSFQVGKYLTRGFFVGLSKNIETDTNTVAIEADITRTLRLTGEWGDDSAGRVVLKWRRDY